MLFVLFGIVYNPMKGTAIVVDFINPSAIMCDTLITDTALASADCSAVVANVEAAYPGLTFP
jgi:hypothetical protein